jgi:hypothetical protein
MAHIEGLVIAGPMMGGPECLGLRPRLEDRAVLPHRVGGIKSVILDFGAFKQLEFDEAGHLVEMTVARQPDFLECLADDTLKCNAKSFGFWPLFARVSKLFLVRDRFDVNFGFAA